MLSIPSTAGSAALRRRRGEAGRTADLSDQACVNNAATYENWARSCETLYTGSQARRTGYSMPEDAQNEILTPLGWSVRLSNDRWRIISEIKHPALKGLREEIVATLSNPDEIKKVI